MKNAMSLAAVVALVAAAGISIAQTTTPSDQQPSMGAQPSTGTTTTTTPRDTTPTAPPGAADSSTAPGSNAPQTSSPADSSMSSSTDTPAPRADRN
ncbi:MAG TPA: hypothetical protein VFL64_01510 [Rhizobacter sp.]|nr:hypothetical protein [Rhizobacter sp.]